MRVLNKANYEASLFETVQQFTLWPIQKVGLLHSLPNTCMFQLIDKAIPTSLNATSRAPTNRVGNTPRVNVSETLIYSADE